MASRHSLRSPIPSLVGAVILAPLVTRILLLFEGGVDLRTADLEGLAADIGISLVLASGLIAATRFGSWFRWVGPMCVGFWCVANFANYEHIHELGSMASLSHAGYLADPTFFRGSVLAPTHPFLLVLTTLASVALVWRASAPDRPKKPHAPLLIGIGLVIVVVAVPQSGAIASWRQTNFLVAQSVRLITHRGAGGVAASFGNGSLAARDLEGTPILDGEGRARNVLLVVLEGVSGAFIPSLRQHHGSVPLFDMPELDRLARRGIAYSSFIATQRQTNRGEFALLCGEYPKLLTAEARMTELVGKGPLNCLPTVMREAGYATVYLQAAPMAFMMKDQFMPQAGFEVAHGDTWFKRSYNRNHWGVDDRAFFETSLDMIEELETAGKPWFLTLLTVGTHHRYNVPPSFEGTHEAGSAAWAFEYLDRAVGEFVSQLESAGILENTLVLFTSDESQATHFGASDVESLVSQGWGFLIALVPERQNGTIGEVFVQPDIPMSIVDYLGLESGRRTFTGRSVFRRYARNREVFWGNTHLGLVAGLTLDHHLVTCTEDFASCGTRSIAGSLLFSPDIEVRDATEAEIEWLRRAAFRRLDSETGQLKNRRIALISPGIHPVVPTSTEQYLFGGQFVSMAANTMADVEIEVEATGDSGWVDLVNLFVVNMQPSYSRTVRVRAGETFRLRYSVKTEFNLDNVECRMWITDFEGEDLGLDFASAELSMSPNPSNQPFAGVVEHTFEVTGGETN